MNPIWLRVRRVLFAVLAVSLMATLSLLILQGRWREAVPLHLCSVCALLSLFLALRPRAWTLDILFYLGMPGAVLALLFPAPAVSACQIVMNASYVVTHAMILVIPAALMIMGMRPRPGLAARMTAYLLIAALAADTVNRVLDTDFFFLAAPPTGTPLAAVYAWGPRAYVIVLALMMLLACMGMDALALRLSRLPAVKRE